MSFRPRNTATTSWGTASRIFTGENARFKNAYLKELAEAAHGWGKIAVMYELDYTDPDIRLWTLKYGCENSIGLSYLANVCATKGRMSDAISDLLNTDRYAGEEKELFRGICDIFTGLLDPEENNDGLNEYGNSFEASRSFTELCERKPELAVSDARAEEIAGRLRRIYK